MRYWRYRLVGRLLHMSSDYKKCEKKCNCKWKMGKHHGDYNYLNNACYLSGAFDLDCSIEKEEEIKK